jgi:hypothetical protein
MTAVDMLVTPTLSYTSCQDSYRFARAPGAFSWGSRRRTIRTVGNDFGEKAVGHKQTYTAY